MPTYQYKREDGTVFEILQGINDEPLTTCPETGQKVNRVISGGAGVVYKGDGWYVTDYKRKEENGTQTSATSNGSANDSKSDTNGSTASSTKENTTKTSNSSSDSK